MIKRSILAVCCCMMSASPLGAVPVNPSTGEDPGDIGPMYCQELMDLEIPVEDGEQGLDLPPLTTEEPPAPEKVEAPSLKGIPRETKTGLKQPAPSPDVPPELLALPMEGEGTEGQPVSAPLPSMSLKRYPGADGPLPGVSEEGVGGTRPTPGISPMILPQPKEVRGREPLPSQPDEVFREIVDTELKEPDQLKTIQPPPAKALSLKVPSGTTRDAPPGTTSTQDIPLLAGKKATRAKGSSAKTASPLALKSVSDWEAGLDAEESAAAGGGTLPSGIYIGRWEELDGQLIDIYERFYKK